MSRIFQNWWRQWLTVADETTTRAQNAVRRDTFTAFSQRPLRLSGLEPRILFSATPIDPALMDSGDDPSVMTAIATNGAIESDPVADSESGTGISIVDENYHEIIFIDSLVPDLQAFLDDLSRSNRQAYVFVLDANRDGVDQISEILDSRVDVTSIHIVSHAENGAVKLGNVWLGESNLAGYAGQIASWQSSLTADADILLYGCDLSSDASGRGFVDSLSVLTGADVAASDDDTGHASFGGNWELEYATGTIDSSVAFSNQFQQTWYGKLATITVNTFADEVSSNGLTSLREAILAVNAGSGGDTINLATGTYVLTRTGANEDAGSTGDLDILKTVTIVGTGSGNTIINANGIDRAFHAISGTVTISGLTIQGGNASAASSGNGGGILVASSANVTISNAVFTGNSARNGGALDSSGTLSLTDVTIDGNTSTMNGGGLTTTGATTLSAVTVSNNIALGNVGGGIEVSSGTFTATNVTVSGNTASSDGGGISAVRPITLQNVTITNNSANYGSGVYLQGAGAANVRNAIIAGNNNSADIYGGFTSQGNNLIGNKGTATGFTHGVNADQVGTSGAPINPLLGSLQNNGGPTFTHALIAGSTAINAGTATGAPSTDQRGFAREATLDIGAFEFSSSANTNPVITSNGGGATAVVNVVENTTAVTTVTATDADLPAQTLVYSISGGADQSKFTINSSTGALSFISAPNFEAPTDSGANNIYDVIVRASDGTLTDTQNIEVTVTNQPVTVLTTTGNATVTAGSLYTLNLSANEDVTSWVINWGDGSVETFVGNPASVTHTYSRVGFTFNILASATDSSGTILQNELLVPTYTGGDSIFRFAPTTGGFLQEFATSNGLDNAIQAIIGPDGNLYVTGEASDNVLRYNATTGAFIDQFVLAGSGGLNSAGGLAFGPDGNLYVANYSGKNVLRYNGTTGAFMNVFTSTGSANPYSLTFGPDGKLYVGMYSSHEVRRYDGSTGALIGTFVSAGSGGLNTPEQIIFGQDGNLYVASSATDQVLRYNGTTGAFMNAFVSAGSGGLDKPSGLAFGPDGSLYVTGLNSDNVLRYNGTTGAFLGSYVTAGSGGLATPTMLTFLPKQQVTVLGNAPVITSNGGGATAAINVAENTTAVTTATATDADLPAQTLTYSISGTDAAKLTINASTGVLSFLAAPNFETPTDVGGNNVYDVILQVSDGTLTDTQAIAITVTPVNDNTPIITSNGGGATAAINVAENTTAVTTATATDADLPAQTLTYSISGADAAKLTINASTGVLSFLVAPNFETPTDAGGNNVYHVILQVSDGTLTDTQAIAISVTPVNDNTPIITSNGGGATAAIDVAEGTTAVTTITATDADLPAQTLNYSIIGGSDSASFVINTSTGALNFVSAPNEGIPTDDGANNVYDVIVQVSDGAFTDTQAIAVTVTAVIGNNPIITSNGGGENAVVNVAENTTSVTTVTATDADLPAQVLTYSISGGPDASKFTINSSTGALNFITAPNYELPTDVGGDNVYELDVRVSDNDGGVDTQAISIMVTPVNESPTVSVNTGITVNEGSALNIIGASMLNGADPDDSDSDLTYTITRVTSNGALRLSGTALGLNDTFTQEDVANDRITYDHNGSETTTDQFDVSLADGGEDGSTIAAGIFNINVTPTNDASVGLPTINGLAMQYETLAANTSGISDADGLGAFTYQWRRNGSAIAGAVAATYALTQSDVGEVITVSVAYTDGQGTTEGPLTSAATALVANVNDVPTGIPTIQGTAKEDETLTASTVGIADSDGLGAFSYQWMRSGIAIGGATSSTYTLTASDVGSKIRVRVSFVDAYSTPEGPLVSSETATVTQAVLAPIPIVLPGTGVPSVSPPVSEKTSDADTSTNSEATAKESTSDSAQEKSTNDTTLIAPSPRASQESSAATTEATLGLSVVELLASDESTDSEKQDSADASGQTSNDVRERSSVSQSTKIERSDSGRDNTSGFGTSVTFVGQIESADFALLTKPGAMWDQLDNCQDSIESQIQGDLIVVGTAGAAASGFTVGIVAWAVRSGFLLSGLVAQIPAWRGIDPLLIMQGGTRGENGETLEELMDRQSKAIEETVDQETIE